MPGHETTPAHAGAAAEMLALAAQAHAAAVDDEPNMRADAALISGQADVLRAYIDIGDLPAALRAAACLGSMAILITADMRAALADQLTKAAAQ